MSLAKGLAITPSQDSRLRSKFAGKALRSVMTELIENNANLTNRDFSGADLSDIDFSGKDLKGCIFEGANIENSIFKKANLSEASLTGAQVSFSDFSRPILKTLIYPRLQDLQFPSNLQTFVEPI